MSPFFPDVIQAFIRHLPVRNDDPESCMVVEGLRAAGPASIRPLADCLASPDVRVRQDAAYVLCQMEHDIAPAFKDLIAAARDPDAGVRMSVASALGEFKGH